MNTKFPWPDIEHEYIRGEMGLRELARNHGINNVSLITRRSKRDEWPRKREEYQTKADAKALELMATEEGRRIAREARVRDNAIDTIDKLISRLSENVDKTRQVQKPDGTFANEPLVIVTPRDIALLIDRLQVLFGRPSTISEERSLGLNFTSTDPDLLRAIVDATRGAAAGGAGESPLPRLADAGEG